MATVTVGDTTAALMGELWERHRGTNVERIAVLEEAALAALDGSLGDDLRAAARREAHKLAGSLGTFGFHEGTRHARVIESLLDDHRPDPQAMSDGVAHLIRELDRPPQETADRPDSKSTGDGDAPMAATAIADRHHLVLVSTDLRLIDRLTAEAGSIELTVVESASEARSLVEADSVDTVVIDLAGLDGGIDRFEEIVSPDSSTRYIALAKADDVGDRVRVARSGGHGYFPRSLPARHLIDLLTNVPISEGKAGARILAVDDDPSQLDALGLILGQAGMVVTPLTDPLEFWETLERTSPDALIVDVDMPDVDGLVLCRMVRNDPRWHRLPVLVLTAGHDAASVQEAFAAGADDYVAKPVSTPQFEARVAAHVERHRLINRLTDVDSLSGVSSRRTVEQSITNLVRLAARQSASLSLVMIDLDNFRQVNARGGHLLGDDVLRATGNLLLTRIRAEDVVGRWGGEEFVLGLLGLDGPSAVERVTAMLDELSSFRFTDLDGRDFAVTFSAGVAEFPRDGTDLLSLVGAADIALYRAKTTRATVCAAVPLDETTPGLERVDVAIIDDDETLADLLAETLRARGLTVRHLDDGLIAAERLGNRSLRARVVLLDIGLPGLDGFGVLQRLRAMGVLDSTRVIMLTGRSNAEEVVRALDLGAADHVSKPFDLSVILERIATLVGG